MNTITKIVVSGVLLLMCGLTQAEIRSDQKTEQAQQQRQFDLLLGLCAGQKVATSGGVAPTPVYGEKFEIPSDEIQATVRAALDECYTQLTGAEMKSKDIQ